MLTVDEVADRVAALIRQGRPDWHVLMQERLMFVDVLKAISAGVPDPAVLAREALRVLDRSHI